MASIGIKLEKYVSFLCDICANEYALISSVETGAKILAAYFAK